MGKVERFEDLVAWQKARKLAAEIYQITRTGEFARDYGLAGQIQRAAVSIMANIAEGLSEEGVANFINSYQWPKLHALKCGPTFILLLISVTWRKLDLISF
jgi:hypothetical protein